MAPEVLTVNVCVKCGAQLPVNSRSRHCPYCGGSLTVKYVIAEKAAAKR